MQLQDLHATDQPSLPPSAKRETWAQTSTSLNRTQRSRHPGCKASSPRRQLRCCLLERVAGIPQLEPWSPSAALFTHASGYELPASSVLALGAAMFLEELPGHAPPANQSSPLWEGPPTPWGQPIGRRNGLTPPRSDSGPAPKQKRPRP